MKYIKTFEKNIEPQIGDFVLCTCELDPKCTFHSMDKQEKCKKFLENNIGTIFMWKSNLKYVSANGLIYYPNVPDDLIDFFNSTPAHFTDWTPDLIKQRGFRLTFKNDILYFAKTKEEILFKINAKKYNL